MNGFIRWITEHPVAANLIMATVVAAGLLSALSITTKTFPDFDLDVIDVSVVYPGASPTEIESSIVRPIEDQLSSIDGVDQMTARAVEGRGNVTLELRLGVDTARTLDDVKAEVDRIDTFPDDAEVPVVVQAEAEERILEITLSGNTSERVLKREAERLEAELLRLPTVSLVELGNVRDDEIAIEIDRQSLAARDLTLETLGRTVAENSLELPGGELETGTLDVPLRTIGRNETGREFESVVVVTGDTDGGRVTLGDIARVEDGFANSNLAAFRDGERSVSVNVFRVGDEQVLDLVTDTQAWLVDEFEPTLPPGITVGIWRNDAQELQGRLTLLGRNAILGLSLVVLCLALFLDLRLALWAAAGIGVAFLGTFVVMDLLGTTINMISLFGFILAIGIVVDNAIVIGENVFRNAESGVPAQEAAVVGAQRMAIPVIFSALTTVIAFTPLLQLPGLLGKFLADIPTIVIIVLLLSLLQSLFILPRNLATVNFDPAHRPNVVVRGFATVRARVDRVLQWFIHGPLDAALTIATRLWMLPLATVVMLMIVTLGVVSHGYVKFSFFPSIDGNYVTVDLQMIDGTAYERTEATAARIADAARRAGGRLDADRGAPDAPLVVGVQTVVGRGAESGGPAGGLSTSGGSLAHVVVRLIDAEQRSIPTAAFEAAWRASIGDLPGIERLTLSSSLVGAGEAIALELSMPDGEPVEPVVDAVRDALGRLPGVIEITDDFATGRLEYTIALRDAARVYGVSVADVARQVRHAWFGYEALRVQRGDDDVPVMVRLPDDGGDSLEDLFDLRIRTPAGDLVPLPILAKLEPGLGPTEIVRRNGRTITTVTADVDNATITAQEANERIRDDVLPRLMNEYAGLIVEFGGEQRTQGDAGSALGQSFAITMFVIFALLAMIFRSYVQPLVVMMAIPLGLIGAVAGHLIIGIPLGLLSIFGLIGLSGVVINNSLVMIDLYNEYLADGRGTRRAVIEGTKDRFRPILLTSLTTFLGIYPLIAETSLQAQFLIPLAVSIGFGVLFGTVIILLAVPALFIAQAKLFRTYVADDAAERPSGIGRGDDEPQSVPT